MKTMIGIIREGKKPQDIRVPLSPVQCKYIQENYPVQFVVQPYESRCFSDQEYRDAGITVAENLADCHVLMGVKEVPIDQLQSHKTYLFFSHTIKKQAYNRSLLQNIMEKHIKMVDYETLTDEKGQRLIAFGRFAGIAGAHNGLMTWARRTGDFDLPQMVSFKDFAEAKAHYKTLTFKPIKICLTGTGRVANGCAEVLDAMGIRKVSPLSFVSGKFDEIVYTQLSSANYVKRRDGAAFDRTDFHQNPHMYESAFEPYTKVTDLFINGIFWDSRAPAFFSLEDMAQPDFNIQVIADVTCDLAPKSSVPSTLDASTIAEPVYGFDPISQSMVAPYQANCIDVMAIDNLPNEMPRDASEAFGQQFIQSILQELIGLKNTGVIERATIAENGDLTPRYEYLRDYVSELV